MNAPYAGTVTAGREFGMAIVAVVGAALYAALTAFTGDNHADLVEWVAIAAAVANAVLIYVVPVFPTHRWLKDVINGVLSVLALGVQVFAQWPLDAHSLLLVAVTFLTGAGVLLAPAVSVKTGGVAPGIGSPTP